MTDSQFLIDLAWVAVAALLVASAAVRIGPWVGDAMEDAAERYLTWRHRTAVDLLARHARHREARHG